MSSLSLGMIHSCTVLSSTQDQKLEFSAGTVAFTEGAALTGADSEATGTVKTVVLETGTWAGEDAAGYLIISTVSGTFQAGEIISDNEGGTATASGPAIPHTNGVGTPQYTTTSTPYSCRFTHSKSGGIITEGSGEHATSFPIVFILPPAVIQKGDHLIGNDVGYNHTYRITAVQTIYKLFSSTISHYEIELKAVEKT